MMVGVIHQEDVAYNVASEYVKEDRTLRRPKFLSLPGKAS